MLTLQRLSMSLTALVLLVVALAGCSCQPPAPGRPDGRGSTADRAKPVKQIVDELIAMPDWGQANAWVGRQDRDNREKIVAGLARIRRHDLDTIRAAIVRYRQTEDGKLSLVRTEKLYVLNKYLFAWPEHYNKPDRGVAPGHAPDALELSMWPFSYGKGGTVELTGSPMLYFAGGPYQALVAFDAARRVYGPRKWPEE